MSGNTVRVNVLISKEIKQFFEEKSQLTGISQSSLMAMALEQHIINAQSMATMSSLGEVIEKLNVLEKKGIL